MFLEDLARQAVELIRAPGRLETLRHDHAILEARLAALEYAATPSSSRAPARSPLDVFAHATR